MARELIGALGRARVLEERDLLLALHKDLSDQNRQAEKDRLKEMSKLAEAELSRLLLRERARNEREGEGRGDDTGHIPQQPELPEQGEQGQ